MSVELRWVSNVIGYQIERSKYSRISIFLAFGRHKETLLDEKCTAKKNQEKRGPICRVRCRVQFLIFHSAQETILKIWEKNRTVIAELWHADGGSEACHFTNIKEIAWTFIVKLSVLLRDAATRRAKSSSPWHLSPITSCPSLFHNKFFFLLYKNARCHEELSWQFVCLKKKACL